MRKALVTLVIGESFNKMFNDLCRKNWNLYCEKFGYELIVIDTPLDNSERAQKRSPAWQKLLILSQPWSKDYNRIVWVDSDVLINTKHAYDIIDGVPEDKVGVVDAYGIPTREIFEISIKRMYESWDKSNTKYVNNIEPKDYYLNRKLPGENLHTVIQAGVFVCSPIFHKQIFEYVYNNYEDGRGNEYNYENPALSYELLRNNLVEFISFRFNFCVLEMMTAFYPSELNELVSKKSIMSRVLNKLRRMVGIKEEDKYKKTVLKNLYDLSIFMHFAGCAKDMYLMEDFIEQ